MFLIAIKFQEIFPTSDSNLVRSFTNICDTFMEPYTNQEHMATVLQIDMRAQIEVHYV